MAPMLQKTSPINAPPARLDAKPIKVIPPFVPCKVKLFKPRIDQQLHCSLFV